MTGGWPMWRRPCWNCCSLPQPEAMTGRTLIDRDSGAARRGVEMRPIGHASGFLNLRTPAACAGSVGSGC